MAARVHHSAIVVRDVDSSLRFYRDGIGLDVLMDHVFEGDWPTLFDASSTSLRSIFLGDGRNPDAGVVELVVLDRPAPVESSPSAPRAGFFLLSFYVDVDEVLERLGALGFGPARRIEQPAPTAPVVMATLRDPDGVRVELVGVDAKATGQ
jgi:catechol 2,3-dioxygenase-like lactoylglutathione lyase family enzyme